VTAVIDPQPSGFPDSMPSAIGPYQVLERLGAGGLGEVFRARDTIHGRTVVIKRVPSAIAPDSERAASLRALAQSLSDVSHPGLASFYACGEQDGALYLAQEYVPGQRLSALIGGRPLNPRRAIEISLDVAEALGALHQKGFRHDDLDPDNIVITPKGHAKLLDAGLAAFTAGGSVRATAGARLGSLPVSSLSTVRYLSPEQALGERMDERSDLFALGAVLYEMLTGQPPFDATSADAAVLRVLQATPLAASRTTPNVPSELDMIVGRLLAKSIDRRYASAGALADDLRTVKTVIDAGLEHTITATLDVPQERSRPTALIVAAAVVLIVLLVWWQLF
jgi:eukaryotic-like serine/threonine-protein kinase